MGRSATKKRVTVDLRLGNNKAKAAVFTDFLAIALNSDFTKILAQFLGFREIVAVAGTCASIRLCWGFSVVNKEFKANSSDERWTSGALRIPERLAFFYGECVAACGDERRTDDVALLLSFDGRYCIHLFHLAVRRLYAKTDLPAGGSPSFSILDRKAWRDFIVHWRRFLFRNELTAQRRKLDG